MDAQQSVIRQCEATFIEQVCTAIARIEDEAVRTTALAMARLEAGTYGYCIDCHAEISAERLDALMFALRCASCDAKLRIEREGAV